MSKHTLYFDRAACSLGVRIALEKAGADYDDQRVAIQKGEAQGEDYLKINPAGRVPALAIDGEEKALTELVAILSWLNAEYPDAGLLPGGIQHYRAVEWLSGMATGLHASGYGPFFRPMRFIEDEEHQKLLSKRAVSNIADGYRQIEAKLGTDGFAFGEKPTAVDYMIYVYARWGMVTGLDMAKDYPKLMALAQKVEALPETQQALAKENLRPING